VTDVRRLFDQSAIQRIVPAWGELFARAARREVVLSPSWALAWYREFGEDDGRTLRALAVEDGGRLIGLALFTRRRAFHRKVVPIRRLELWMTGEPREHEVWSEYVGVLAEAGREGEVAEALATALSTGRSGRFDELSITRASSDDPLIPALATALERRGFEVTTTPGAVCPYARLPSTWDGYLKGLKKGYRYAVRLSLAELEKWADGKPIQLRSADDPRAAAEGFAVLQRLHALRWAHQREGGLFASDRFTRFHERVVPRLFDDGHLDLLWLTVGEQPVAALYNLVAGGRSQVYQSGRVVDVPRRLSLGTAMHAHAIQRAIARGDREYDFLGGPTLYKRQLSTDTRTLVDLVARAPHLRAQAAASATRLVDQLAARVRPLLRRKPPTAAASRDPDAAEPEETVPISNVIPPPEPSWPSGPTSGPPSGPASQGPESRMRKSKP
jgi:hypothetical protein